MARLGRTFPARVRFWRQTRVEEVVVPPSVELTHGLSVKVGGSFSLVSSYVKVDGVFVAVPTGAKADGEFDFSEVAALSGYAGGYEEGY